MKYLFAFLLGGIAALCVGHLIAFAGGQTTIDAWILTLTIAGQDVGDRMMMVFHNIVQGTSFTSLLSIGYLVGHTILEEIIKFIAFFIAFRINKPTSIREIIVQGVLV